MKQHLTKILALALALVMVLSVFPAVSFATEEGEAATLISGLPADGSYGVIYYCGATPGMVMGYDLNSGTAPAKTVQLSPDGSAIPSLPNGAAVFKFIKNADDTYYLMLGDKYLAIKLNSQNTSEIVLQDSIDGAKWDIVSDNAGAYYISSHDVASNFKYLEYYSNAITAYKMTDDKTLYQFKFFSCSADEDGRVGEPPVAGDLPVDGGTYVVYNHYGKAVMGQPTGADASAPALLAAAATLTDGALAYENIEDGGMIFTVHVSGTDANPIYTFENNGKYLAMPENTVDENGKVNNAETLLMIDPPTDPEKLGYTQWTLVERTGGYEMKNKAAKYGNYYCSIEFFNEVFSGWTFKASTVELFAMNFFPMEDREGTGYVVNPSVTIKEPAPAIGSDCLVEFEIHDVSEPTLVVASYKVDNGAFQDADHTLEVRKGSFTVPAADLEGGKKLTVRVRVEDTLGKSYDAAVTADIRDEPLILSAFPAANSATGEEKRPEIGVTFANVKENPTFAMLLDGEAVTGAVSGDRYVYTPEEDLSEEKHTASVTITRADSKSVTKSWSFFVGEGGETLYFGQIHSHTAEYSDGVGTLEDAYEHAHEVADLDFLIVTDHSNYFDTTATATTDSYYHLDNLLKNAAGTTTKWEEARATAKAYNELYDDFLCVYGYEMTWSGGPGHTNTFNTRGVVSRNNIALNNKTGYAGMHLYNDLMVNADKGLDVNGDVVSMNVNGVLQPVGPTATKNIPYDENGLDVPVVSQFNHPGKTFGNFDNYAGYSAKRDDVLNLIEVGNGEGKVGGSAYFPSYAEYDKCLSMGWHVAPTNNQDNHKGNWGDSNTCRDVILTDDFSEIGLYRALDARRVYATEDQNLRIFYELIANGETYKLGDIAPIEEDEQPETVTIKLHIEDPDRNDKIASVEIIGEGGKTLKRVEVNAERYEALLELPNTDGYYYVKVVEEDGAIAVTAPVWVKEAVPVAVELETSASVAAQGEEETITATLTNGSDNAELTILRYKVEAEGRVLEEKTGINATVAAGTSQALIFPFTPSVTDPAATKTYEITVTFGVLYKGKTLIYTKTIQETSYPASMMTYIGLDKGHDNFYVSGDYANNDGNFIQICAQRGIICQYIDKGQMTPENLAKYKAIVITVPRINEQTAPTTWTQEELDALADYAAKGGSIINFSKSDRYDYAELVDGKDSYNYASATLSNAINKAVGAKTRFVRGIVVDNARKANEAYRINFTGRELLGDHDFTAGIYPSSNGIYQWYNGTGITVDMTLGYKDVKSSSWFHDAVDYVIAHGLMSGTENNVFSPNMALTREMFVFILWKIAGSPEPTVENPFKDVKRSHYSYKAILWAYETGVTAGVGNGRFGRTDNVTRQDMAAFLYKFAGNQGMDLTNEADLSGYPDPKDISKYARPAMRWAVANNLISGIQETGGVYLRPKQNSTRAQVAVIIRNFAGLMEEELPLRADAPVALVEPYDTSWVASYKANFTGSSYEPDYENDTVMARKGTFALTTVEQLSGGGFLVCSGATFISNYDLKYGTAANEQYENYMLVCRILDFIKTGPFEGEITPIADVTSHGQELEEFTIEGWVTSNASDYDKDTAFFDCIYVQDDTRGINCFPVSGYYFIGEQVRVHGGVTYYCGEIELNLSTDYNGSIEVISNDLNIIEPTPVTCAEAMSDENIGLLMMVTGTITDIHETAGVVDMVYVDDGSGEEAMLFINGYIQKESHALDGIAVGMNIEGVGIGSRDVDEASGGVDGQVGEDIDPSLFIKRLRVRSRDELIIWNQELDTTDLEAAIAEAQGLDRNLYTPESLAAVDEALAAALAVMENADKTQREVEAAARALRAALDALELKTTHDLYAPVTALKDGDVVVIYNPGHERAIKNGNYRDWYMLTGEVTFDEDELIQDPAEDLLWTVHIDEEGNYSFSNGENKIVMWLSGNYAEVTNNAAIEGADPLWTLTASTTTEGLYYIGSKTIAHETKGPGYLEVYNKTVDNVSAPYVTGYFSNSPADKDYGFRFYSQIHPGYYPVTAPKDGDEVVIYNPGHERAIKNGNYRDWYMLTGEVTFDEDELIQDPAEDLLWTVHIDEEGNYSFSNGENKIVMWLSGNYAEVTNNAAIEGADPLWTLTASTTTEGLYYIGSKTIAHETKGPGYLEVYNKTVDNVSAPYVTGYFSNSPADKDYGFRFYKFGYGPETEAPPVNKTALITAIEAAQALVEADYTAESWAALQTALSDAIAVRDNEEATQAQVNEALSALNNAVSALVRVPAANADVYELVTTAPEDWSGTYLIVAEDNGITYVFNGNEEVNGHVTTTVTDNRITFIEGMEPVVIAAMEGGYSLHVTNGYMYGTNSANGLKFDEAPKLATIELDASGNAVIVSDTATFRFNNASNQLRFRFYKPNSGTNMPPVKLYKLVED